MWKDSNGFHCHGYTCHHGPLVESSGIVGELNVDDLSRWPSLQPNIPHGTTSCACRTYQFITSLIELLNGYNPSNSKVFSGHNSRGCEKNNSIIYHIGALKAHLLGLMGCYCRRPRVETTHSMKLWMDNKFQDPKSLSYIVFTFLPQSARTTRTLQHQRLSLSRHHVRV